MPEPAPWLHPCLAALANSSQYWCKALLRSEMSDRLKQHNSNRGMCKCFLKPSCRQLLLSGQHSVQCIEECSAGLRLSSSTGLAAHLLVHEAAHAVVLCKQLALTLTNSGIVKLTHVRMIAGGLTRAVSSSALSLAAVSMASPICSTPPAWVSVDLLPCCVAQVSYCRIASSMHREEYGGDNGNNTVACACPEMVTSVH